jgi:hypothetical protein
MTKKNKQGVPRKTSYPYLKRFFWNGSICVIISVVSSAGSVLSTWR